MRKIDVLIIGAQKAGTTSLKNYLNEHPDVLGHPQKEFAYYKSAQEFEKSYEEVFKQAFTIGKKDAKIVLAKNAGMYEDENSIQRLKQQNPDCKLIFILREPVARTISAFQMEKFNGWLQNEFSEVIDTINNKDYTKRLYTLFVGLSLYANHIEMLLKYFPMEQIKLYLFEDLKSTPDVIFKDVCNWIGIDSNFQPDFSKKHNVTVQPKSKWRTKLISKLKRNNNPIKKIAKAILPYSTFTKLGEKVQNSNKSNKKFDPIPSEYREILQEHFKPFNKKLEEIYGLNLNKWNKKID